MTGYAVYSYPEKKDLTNNTIAALIKTGRAEFVRWDFAGSITEGIYKEDADLCNNEWTIIYVYFKDDSLTPFHQNTEVDNLVKEHLPESFDNYEPGKFAKANIVKIKIPLPIIEHVNAPKERKKK